MIDPELQGAGPLLAPEMIFLEISPKNEPDSSNPVFVSDLFGTTSFSGENLNRIRNHLR